jgi:hypothetical protein
VFAPLLVCVHFRFHVEPSTGPKFITSFPAKSHNYSEQRVEVFYVKKPTANSRFVSPFLSLFPFHRKQTKQKSQIKFTLAEKQ